jgi:RNA polymerase sigma factor (sigma-70 family)
VLAECRAAVRRVLANQGWTLVDDHPAFLAEVTQTVRDGRGRPGDTLRQRADRAVIRAYCPILYAACAERAGPRAIRGFEELGRYLHAIALTRCADPHLAADGAQRALELIWRHLDEVRDPWAFLGYCRIVLIREINDRLKAKTPLRFVPLRGDDPEEPGVHPADPQAEVDRAEVDRAMEDASLRQAIRTCLRSKQQREVIIRLFLEEESVTQVADALGMTPANVWVLKSRALSRLRQCPDVVRMLE